MMTRSRTEELKLVFALNEAADSIDAVFGDAAVRMQPRTGVIGHLDALRVLVDKLRELGIGSTFFEGGKAVSFDSVIKKVEKGRGWGRLETTHLTFQYGVTASDANCFISIQENAPNAAGEWKEWVEAFAWKNGFIQGWVSDVEYNHWQNARDPAKYEIAGRDFSNLPMRSNGLPPPLERLEIDTSKNPGRRVLRSGYVEAVGSRMWLGDLFWKNVGKNGEDGLIVPDWVRVSEPMTGILEIKVSEQSFNSEETADIQNRLRNFLYG
ncbi:hypothetical protein ACQUJT_23280 [Ralstonia pseudosolanacearum]